MLLVIDVGNSQTALGLFSREKVVGSWRVETLPEQTADERAVEIAGLLGFVGCGFGDVSGVCIASVVPSAQAELLQMCALYFNSESLVVSHDLRIDISIDYDRPEAVGADRIANAVAGFHSFGGPLAIVDFGTATTIDVVSADGVYLGGVISPGIMTGARALFESAAMLSGVVLEPPERYIGKDTAASLRSGVMLGTAAMVDGLVTGVKEEISADTRVVATGGLVQSVAPLCRTVDEIEPLLTLTGLRLIWEMNRP